MRWTGALLTLVPLALFVLAPWLAGASLYPSAVLFGSLSFLLYRLIVVRAILCRDHRRGVVLTRRGRFEEAVVAFEASERVWGQRPTLDRFRALLLGSATPYRFTVLARYNRAYALSRLGRGEESLAILQNLLAEDASMLPARELRDVLLAGATLHREVGEALEARI